MSVCCQKAVKLSLTGVASSLASQLPQGSRAPLNLWELACQR